jgi:MFS family permease
MHTSMKTMYISPAEHHRGVSGLHERRPGRPQRKHPRGDAETGSGQAPSPGSVVRRRRRMLRCLAPAGRMSDARGRKLVYTYGFGVFTAASAACGLAPGLTALVAFRLVQAARAAMLQANSVALVTTSVPKAKMRFALGLQAGAQSLGLALGPTLGGLITVTVGWRFVYWFNVPVGIMAVVAARYLLPRTRDFGSPDRFDWPGTSLLAVCTAGLLLALSARAA